MSCKSRDITTIPILCLQLTTRDNIIIWTIARAGVGLASSQPDNGLTFVGTSVLIKTKVSLSKSLLRRAWKNPCPQLSAMGIEKLNGPLWISNQSWFTYRAKQSSLYVSHLLSIHLWAIQGGDHLIANALERIVTDVHPPLTLQWPNCLWSLRC
jgi:hypothetical protein